MEKMGVNFKTFAAICTDNPSVMVAVQRKLEENDPVLLVRYTIRILNLPARLINGTFALRHTHASSISQIH